MISDARIKEWTVYRDRLVRVGDVGKVRLARRELLCWEYMARLERHCAEIIKLTQVTKNIPGELRYHLEAMARHVETSERIAAGIREGERPRETQSHRHD